MIICILNEFDRKLLLYFKQNYCWRRELGTAWVLPPKHGHGGRILRPESMLHLSSAEENNSSCRTGHPGPCPKEELQPSLGALGSTGHRDCLGVLSVCESPKQFRNYVSCFHFRSKTQTLRRNEPTQASLCLFLKERQLCS